MNKPVNRCRVLIVDDSEDLAVTLATLIDFEPDLEAVGWVATATQALERARELAADVLLLDLSLADGSGFSVLDQATSSTPRLKVIIHTGHATPELAATVKARGALACVAKGEDFELLCNEIRRAWRIGRAGE